MSMSCDCRNTLSWSQDISSNPNMRRGPGTTAGESETMDKTIEAVRDRKKKAVYQRPGFTEEQKEQLTRAFDRLIDRLFSEMFRRRNALAGAMILYRPCRPRSKLAWTAWTIDEFHDFAKSNVPKQATP